MEGRRAQGILRLSEDSPRRFRADLAGEKTMRDSIVFYVNGRRIEARGAEAFLTLAEFLRGPLGLTGTKVVCAEGDCGACAVLAGRAEEGRLRYRAINSCIQFVYQQDGAHIVTVEGLAAAGGGRLHAAQESMIERHGSQCGFCTPGFVISLTALFEAQPAGAPRRALTEAELRSGLSGNLCRCTGYAQILEAGLHADPAKATPLAELYPEEAMLAEFARLAGESARVEADVEGAPRLALLPATLDEAVALRAAHPEAAVVAGATDLGVMRNKGRLDPGTHLSLENVRGLDEATARDGVLTLGATATWTRVAEVARAACPQLSALLETFGSPLIRNAGGVGGNLVNASPISDSIPFFLVTEAQFDLIGPEGRRSVAAREFYRGYKVLAMRPGELLWRVRAPLPGPGETLRLYKVSRRHDLDIATFTAAILCRRENGRIAWARLAFGGVGPVVLRLPETEALLAGREFTEAAWREAGAKARTEISPISDVRGSAEYRAQLAENITLKFYYDCEGAA